MDRVVEQYLERYAEPSARDLSQRWLRSHQAALVVPFFDETMDDLERLRQAADAADTLLIAVINAPDNAPGQALARTRQMLAAARASNAANLMVVDRASAGRQLPRRQGVGLARKLGTDIACWLWRDGKLRQPWIYQSDADATLPDSYFALPGDTNIEVGALVCTHHHTSDDPQLARAARLYEWHMAYYHTRLQKFGSSYAYPTLGSTIIVHAAAYAQVRGYPRRNAAEDFYLLNKVTKVAGVTYLPEVEVLIRARRSARVPFGTGPTLERLCALLTSDPTGEAYLSYNPRAFDLLGDTLSFLHAFTTNPAQAAPAAAAPILETLNFQRIAAGLHKNHPTAPGCAKALADWFDARRTLRFVHETRRYWPDTPLLATLRALTPAECKIIGFPA